MKNKTKLTEFFATYRMMSKRVAFTLAEVLITLGIIGIVAAMTIPVIMRNYRAIVLKTQFNRAYSMLQQVVLKMQGGDDFVFKSNNRNYLAMMTYFKNPIDCGVRGSAINRTNKFCYNVDEIDKYKNYANYPLTNNYYFCDGMFALPDGTLFMFEDYGQSLWISVDINGYNNKPNRLGYDVFTFQYTSDGKFKPMGDAGTTRPYCDSSRNDNDNGLGCAVKAVNDPDYFKKLKW